MESQVELPGCVCCLEGSVLLAALPWNPLGKGLRPSGTGVSPVRLPLSYGVTLSVHRTPKLWVSVTWNREVAQGSR